MEKEFRLADPGEGIHEAEIVEILVSEGDQVEEDQSIMVIETDKAATEVPSPFTGVVKKISVAQGDTVKVGDVLMVFEVDAEEAEDETEKTEAKAKKAEDEEEKEEKAEDEEEKKGAEAEEETEEKEVQRPVPAVPSTRRVARELGVDLHEVEPSGPGGRVTTEDVKAYAEKKEQKPGEKAEKKPSEKEKKEKPSEEKEKKKPARSMPEASALPDFSQWGEVERIALRSVRRATAKRMQLSWSEIPHVTHQDVADITELEAFRRKHKAEIENEGGALTLTIFAIKAAVAALKSHPRFNASIDMDQEEILLKHYYHIAVAVDTDRGLLVPVIRDADRKSITDLAMEFPALAEKTRKGEIKPDDLSGGSFTITNVGSLGGTGFAPIINYPQAAILGMARARLQPVVIGDMDNYRVKPRLMLPLILGFDHRIADGADAARFMKKIVSALESPEKLMMLT